ncbi:MAG: SDR family oxidoreductase [Maritimibacter harenae]|jgi:NAD(P)-dependent dehydrogenase (short-subunit alcohol dehydrogenase family)|uniref:SDR family NAD(P)-dependent oxidoreductase n=1 Tax=Maritimibacter harenae TaxID=2606218 RepID=A0A845M7J3_9RHOB|nr:SDR family oxidoreductase [Maritimibacter harenae]MZR15099.1 SDR family NAD(P)-dependent oxidoreductase [Maritimibacter harenae]
MDMTGKTVVITGASRGIGEAAARVFAEAGANVALLARSGDALATLAEELGEGALALECDVASFESVQNAVDETIGRFGGVDVLINNAGVIEPIAHMADSDPDDWDRVIDINLKGVYHGMRAVLPAMQKARGGTILTISSGAAHGALEGWSHYCVSKAGVHMMTKALHKEEVGNGIRAIGLSPGTVATEMQREIKASGVNPVSQLDWSDHIPADWPAKCLLWLCGPDGDAWLGQEVSLRDEDVRRAVGLVA